MIVQITQHIPTTAADTTDEWYLPMSLPGTWRLISAQISPATTTAANGTNYVAVDLSVNDGAGGSFTALASSLDTSATALTVGVTRTFTLSGAARDITQGQQIKIAKTDPGTGGVLDGDISFVFMKVN